MTSPAITPSSRACWSGVPERANVAATTFTGINGPGVTARPISSATMVKSTMGRPEMLPPPSDSGTISEVQPSSAADRQKLCGQPSARSCHSRTVPTGHSASMKRREVSRNSS